MGKPTPSRSLAARSVAEGLGTFILVFLGCGAVHAAVLTNAQSGVWQVAIVWGLGVMLAGYAVGGVSGAHVNPAITIALAVHGKFPPKQVWAYVVGQLTGAFTAAAVLFVLYQPLLAEKEAQKHVVRGQAGSEITAMCYGEYFPNPAPLAGGQEPHRLDAQEHWNQQVSETGAFVAEVMGTLLLALAVFALTDRGRVPEPAAALAPLLIGLILAGLISVIAPLTQACFNPARDFGPRLFASLAGWGRIALPGPRGLGFLTVYIVAPTLGAVAGGGLYERWLRPRIPELTTETRDDQ